MMNNPLVTMLIITYNQEEYIRDAIHGAFSQTYSPLEIIISDDFSQDRTFDIIQEEVAAYDGPHKITVNRNEQNLGIVQHVNHVVFNVVNSEYIVLAAGDDVALDNRASVAMHTLQTPDCLAGCSNGWRVGRLLESPVPLYRWKNERRWKVTDGILMASLFFRRSLLLEAGPIPDYMRGEGMWITVHALARGNVLYTPEYAIKYRQLHDSSSGVYYRRNRNEVIKADKNFQRILLALKQDLISLGLYCGKSKKFISALWGKKEFKLVCLDESKSVLDRLVSWVKCGLLNPSVFRDFTDVIRPDQALH